MVEIYISWVKGLPQNKEALNNLRNNNIGIEMSNIDDQVNLVKFAGVKFSSHTPGRDLLLNLASSNYFDVFLTSDGNRMLDVIRNSDAKTVGFHCGYSAKQVMKMYAYPNLPNPGSMITDRNLLLDIITDNIIKLENVINKCLKDEEKKFITIESLDYCRGLPVPWDKQSDFVKSNKYDIQDMIAQYGANAGIIYVTEPDFISDLFNKIAIKNNENIGFCFDISHVFISADSKIFNYQNNINNLEQYGGFVIEYFNDMLMAVSDKVYQLHLNCPEGNYDLGFLDHHKPFFKDNIISDYLLDLLKSVISKISKPKVITYEIRSNAKPVSHVNDMLKQIDYVTKKIEL